MRGRMWRLRIDAKSQPVVAALRLAWMPWRRRTWPIVYHAGESFTDIGCGDVHLVRNEGTVCAVNTVVQIIPAGLPRRIDADQPANCPVFTCASPTPCPQ